MSSAHHRCACYVRLRWPARPASRSPPSSLEDGNDLFEPPVGCALGVADPDFGVLVCAPDDPVAADVIEEEEAGEEARLANFAVPYEEAASEAPVLACAASRDLDAVLFVGEEHKNVPIARIERRTMLVDRHPPPEFARYAPGSVDAVAETIDEGIDYIGVIDASVVGAVDGAELAGVAVPSYQDADILDAAGEAQIVVEAVRDHRGRDAGLAEIAGRRI